MGMDIHGKKPTTEEGKYFRNSAWWWRPLARYIAEVAPDIAKRCKYWQSNDGDGLNATNSIALADRLQDELDSGRTEKYARVYTSRLEALPDIDCNLCNGTGTRKPIPERGAGDLATGIRCNACNGEGHVRPYDTYYPFDVENVKHFVVFLRGCGGFKIW